MDTSLIYVSLNIHEKYADRTEQGKEGQKARKLEIKSQER